MKTLILSLVALALTTSIALGDETYAQKREREVAEIAAKNLKDRTAGSVVVKADAKSTKPAKRQPRPAKPKPKAGSGSAPMIVPAMSTK